MCVLLLSLASLLKLSACCIFPVGAEIFVFLLLSSTFLPTLHRPPHSQKDPNVLQSAAVDFMYYSGYTVFAYMWVRMEVASLKALANKPAVCVCFYAEPWGVQNVCVVQASAQQRAMGFLRDTHSLLHVSVGDPTSSPFCSFLSRVRVS